MFIDGFKYKSALVLLAVAASSAFAQLNANRGGHSQYPGAVFVMTNNVAGNQILRFGRNADGTLVPLGSTDTGGRGSGGTVDPLGSQNSLLLTQDGSFLLAVNSASGTISSFEVDGVNLRLVDIELTGGSGPNAIAQWGNLVYVLNVAGNSNVVGFHFEGGHLWRIPNAIGYLSTSISGGSSITFTQDGKFLLAAERVSGKIDGFPVNANGTLGKAGVTAYPGIFSLAIAPGSGLLLSVGGPNLGASAVNADGTITVVNSQVIPSGACWVVATSKGFVYGSTGGGDIIDGYSVAGSGALTPIGTGNVATLPNSATDNAKPLDLALSSDGKFLYSVNAGDATIGVWTIDQNAGSLTAQTPVTLGAANANAGFNGIAAY